MKSSDELEAEADENAEDSEEIRRVAEMTEEVENEQENL